MIWHWFLHYTGSDNVSGPWYGFWSGFGSDLGEVTLLAAMFGIFKKNNCHESWCLRLGHHPFTHPETGVLYKLCRKHHPDHPGKKAIKVGAGE